MAEFLLTSDPKSITPAQYRKMLREFIEERLFAELESLAMRVVGPSAHTSVEVFCSDLIDFDPTLGFYVIHFPKLLLPIFDEAIFEAQTNLCTHSLLEVKHGRKGSVKIHCHIRLVSLPPTEYLNKPTISDIRADDVDSLIQISGKVVRTGAVRMLEISKKYECQNPRCMYRFTILADPEQDNMLPQPRTCPCPSTDVSGTAKKCHSTNLRELEGFRVCVDYQELKVQDSFERVSLGSIPRSIVVILEADLVDKYNAGDDVIIVGVLVRQWKPVWKGARCVVDIALRANSIRALNANDRHRVVSNDTVSQFDSFWQPYRDSNRALEGRDLIIKSICPQLYGLFFVKLALLLTLVGGSITQADRGVKRRSQSHLLVVGDPGCGKSQILRFAAAVVSRSVLTTGIGTSGAGLTCTAVRDGSDWSLEAGALVLANDGVCCIDEFASIKDQDRVTIHEAMEQQSISVAKAGLVVKLNTRTTVLACCNPKGTYDVSADISTNTAIASPLLSRFDLVLVLLDSPQKDWDKRVSTFLLQQAVNAGVHTKKGNTKLLTVDKKEEEGSWDLIKLKDYIAYVKHNFQPTMSKEAQFLLMRYYQMQRQSEERSSGRTTVRLLESLMRLSEAHAKLMGREMVLLEDAVVAVSCVNLSQEQTSLLDANSTLHSDFPPNPQQFYEDQEAKVFSLLHCSKQSLLKEILLEEQDRTRNIGSSGRKADKGDNGDENENKDGNRTSRSRRIQDGVDNEEIRGEFFPATTAYDLTGEDGGEYRGDDGGNDSYGNDAAKNGCNGSNGNHISQKGSPESSSSSFSSQRKGAGLVGGRNGHTDSDNHTDSACDSHTDRTTDKATGRSIDRASRSDSAGQNGQNHNGQRDRRHDSGHHTVMMVGAGNRDNDDDVWGAVTAVASREKEEEVGVRGRDSGWEGGGRKEGVRDGNNGWDERETIGRQDIDVPPSPPYIPQSKQVPIGSPDLWNAAPSFRPASELKPSKPSKTEKTEKAERGAPGVKHNPNPPIPQSRPPTSSRTHTLPKATGVTISRDSLIKHASPLAKIPLAALPKLPPGMHRVPSNPNNPNTNLKTHTTAHTTVTSGTHSSAASNGTAHNNSSSSSSSSTASGRKRNRPDPNPNSRGYSNDFIGISVNHEEEDSQRTRPPTAAPRDASLSDEGYSVKYARQGMEDNHPHQSFQEKELNGYDSFEGNDAGNDNGWGVSDPQTHRLHNDQPGISHRPDRSYAHRSQPNTSQADRSRSQDRSQGLWGGPSQPALSQPTRMAPADPWGDATQGPAQSTQPRQGPQTSRPTPPLTQTSQPTPPTQKSQTAPTQSTATTVAVSASGSAPWSGSSQPSQPTQPTQSTKSTQPQHSQHSQHSQQSQHTQHSQQSQHAQHSQHTQQSQHSQHTQRSQHTQHIAPDALWGHLSQPAPTQPTQTPPASATSTLPLPPTDRFNSAVRSVPPILTGGINMDCEDEDW